jgi:hypothetical protein
VFQFFGFNRRERRRGVVVFMPQPITCYNGDIILYAHGYVSPGAPPDAWLTQLGLPD